MPSIYHYHSCLCLKISDSLERQVRKSPEFGDNTSRCSWIEISSSQHVVIIVKQVRKYIKKHKVKYNKLILILPSEKLL